MLYRRFGKRVFDITLSLAVIGLSSMASFMTSALGSSARLITLPKRLRERQKMAS